MYNDHPQTQYVQHEVDDVYDESIVQTGKQRVIRLLLIVLVALLIVGLIIFGLIPYVAMLNQPIALPLPPAIQT
ncbi:MAG: hypothetical protein WBC91_08245 [Phototrophicaceae bacterium]